MAKIDRLVANLNMGESLLMETNSEPMIKSGTMPPTPMLNQTLTGDQVKGLINEIAPLGSGEKLEAGEAVSFAYTHETNSFSVAIKIEEGQVKARIVRVEEAPAEVAAVEAPMAEAPTAPVESAPPAATAEPAEKPAATATPAPAAPREGAPAIEALFHKMVADDASDLHLSSQCRPILRISGDLIEIEDHDVLDPDELRKLLHEITPHENMVEFEECSDTDFPYEIPGLARFRCNIFLDHKGIGAVFRQIPIKILTSEQLGLSKEILDLCYLSKGLVLVTGPTGSGKSTTLAAMIDYINRNRNCHIITIEDPIEFVHPNKQCLLNQREVRAHTKSFSSALRAALREDPDILLVGEMRDLETISIAIETAETGHLVFGTLHTTTAASTVDRIIDQFPADRQEQIRTMVAGSLKGVVAQTLCKKKGGGRVAAQEILICNAAVANLIREGKVFQIPSIIQTGGALGMELLNAALMKLVTDDLVEPEEAYINAVDKSGLVNLLKAKNIQLNLGSTPVEE